MYSSRPDNHIANDLIFKDKTHILFLPYGREWRLMRKTLQELLRTTVVDEILPIQEAESIQTLHHLMHSPERWFDHVRRYSTAVILASVFGLRGAHFDSPRVKALYEVQDQNTAINELSATPPVDIFPFLKSLPGFVSPWKKWAKNIRTEYRELLVKLVEDSKISGMDCFFAKMMRAQEKSGLTEEQVAYLGGILVGSPRFLLSDVLVHDTNLISQMEAGSDTTASTLLSFLLALASRPQVLRKCQEEVDQVVGMERSPSAVDMLKLPYLRAVMKEVRTYLDRAVIP
jgi:cytochrome P450